MTEPEALPTFEEIRLRLRPEDKIMVCDKCLTASCWMAHFVCEDWKTAGTTEITIAEARKLNREHPDTWRELRREEGAS